MSERGSGRDRWIENVRVGVEALRIHPLRTLLSVLGILIGSAALIATMAISDGMMSFARDQVLRNTSVQVVTVSPKTSVYRNGEWLPNHDHPVFTEADVAGLRRQLGDASAVALMLGGRASVGLRGAQCRASVVLGSANLMELQSIDLAAGRFFNAGEASRNAGVVVLNYALAAELSARRDPMAVIGRKIRVNGCVRRVIGILTPTGFEDRGNPSFTLYAPIRAAGALLDPPPFGHFAPSLLLRAARVETVEDVRDAAADWLSRRHARLPQRVNISIALQELRQVEVAFLLIKLFIGALVGISLLVGGIGIMNVLLASVTERTREIGIRKSVGASPVDIHTQFVAESVAIALVGATAGLVIGLVIAIGVTAVFRAMVGAPVHAVLSPGSVLVATLSSSVIGLVFGTYPARRAARLSPIVALAHE